MSLRSVSIITAFTGAAICALALSGTFNAEHAIGESLVSSDLSFDMDASCYLHGKRYDSPVTDLRQNLMGSWNMVLTRDEALAEIGLSRTEFLDAYDSLTSQGYREICALNFAQRAELLANDPLRYANTVIVDQAEFEDPVSSSERAFIEYGAQQQSLSIPEGYSSDRAAKTLARGKLIARAFVELHKAQPAL